MKRNYVALTAPAALLLSVGCLEQILNPQGEDPGFENSSPASAQTAEGEVGIGAPSGTGFPSENGGVVAPGASDGSPITPGAMTPSPGQPATPPPAATATATPADPGVLPPAQGATGAGAGPGAGATGGMPVDSPGLAEEDPVEPTPPESALPDAGPTGSTLDGGLEFTFTGDAGADAGALSDE